MRLSLHPDPEKARLLLWLAAAFSGLVTPLALLGLGWGWGIFFLLATLTLAVGGWTTNAGSTTGRWTAGDFLLIVAIAGVGEFYTSIVGLFGNSPLVKSTEVVAQYAVAAGGVFIVLVTRRGVKPVDLGLRLPSSWRWFLLVPFFLVAAYLSSDALQSWQSHLHAFRSVTNTQCVDIKKSFGTGLVGYLAGFPAVCVAAALVEETIFRGVLYGWLASLAKRSSLSMPLRRVALGAAMITSGLIFGFFHSPAYGILPILPLSAVGTVLAALYEWSGSLYPGMITHASFNAIGLYMLLLTQNSC